MSYAHQGPAHVTVSARHFSAEPVEVRNDAVTVNLAGSGTPGIARLEFARLLRGSEDATHVRVTLPNRLEVGGAILQGENHPDGSGWLTFSVDETGLGL